MVFSRGSIVRKQKPSTGLLSQLGLENVTNWTLGLSSQVRATADANVDGGLPWNYRVANLLLNRILQREPEKPKTRYEKAKLYASEKVSQVQQRLK